MKKSNGYILTKKIAALDSDTIYTAFETPISELDYILWLDLAKKNNICGVKQEMDYDNGLTTTKTHWLEDTPGCTVWMTLTMRTEEL